MAIRITEDSVVNYENSPDVNRKLFPNLNVCGKEIGKLEEEINGKAPAVFSTTSGSIASFDNGADDMPLKSCVVTIEPIQEGEGDPSPENVRPISGRTGLTVSHSGADVSDPTTISVNWETEVGTVYSGTLDVINGKLVVDSVLYNLNTSRMNNSENYPGWKNTGVVDVIGLGVQTANYSIISNIGKTVAVNTAGSGTGVIYLPTQTYIKTQSEWIAEALDVQILFKSINPVEYQLTPQEIRTLLGENNIWSDAGDVSVDYPADTKTYIDDLSIKTVEVTGQTPTITAEENTRYICGEVTSLSFTPSEKGICDVRFTVASISTVLTLPETVKLPEWFDPTLLEANTTYEINIVDGVYGVVMSWA